jgi:hypothetical protein
VTFHGNRRSTRHRILAATAGAAAVALEIVACTAHGTNVSVPSPSSTASAASTAPSPAGPSAVSAADSCTGAPLKSQLAEAVEGGASLIVATGTLTGKSVTGDPAASGAPAFYAMTLKSAQTLRGPVVRSGSTAWIPGPAPGTVATPENSALLAPGGRLFAIVWPKSATHDPVGPTLRLAPIVGTDVVFTPYDCWDLTGLAPGQYQESAPLFPVPRGRNFGGAQQAAENGIYMLPLATVRQLAASA